MDEVQYTMRIKASRRLVRHSLSMMQDVVNVVDVSRNTRMYLRLRRMKSAAKDKSTARGVAGGRGD